MFFSSSLIVGVQQARMYETNGFDHFSVPAKMRYFFIKILMAFFKGQHMHTKIKILWIRAVYCLRLRLICVIWSHGCCFRTRCPPLHPEENSSLFPPDHSLATWGTVQPTVSDWPLRLFFCLNWLEKIKSPFLKLPFSHATEDISAPHLTADGSCSFVKGVSGWSMKLS